jgi:hypothetical protein
MRPEVNYNSNGATLRSTRVWGGPRNAAVQVQCSNFESRSGLIGLSRCYSM